MNQDQEALLGVIRAFKRSEVSELEAALNAIMHHAETIREQQERIESLEARLAEIQGLTTQPPPPEPGEES